MHIWKFLFNAATLRESLFRVPRLCLNAMGYWPEVNRSGRNPRAIVNFIILTIGVATELHAGFTYLQGKNLALALETLCPAGTSAVTLLKMFLILYFHKDLYYVVERLRELLQCDDSAPYSDVDVDDEKKRIMYRYAGMATRLNFWPLSAGFFTCTTYNLKPVLLAMWLWLNGKVIIWNTPFNMTMPSVLMHAPWFPLTYVFIAYTGYVTVFMFGGCDGFYFEFCAQIAALLELLQADMRAVFKPYQHRLSLNLCESLHIERLLKVIIKRHNDIIDLTNYFRRRYAIITLAHFLSASMVIGMSILDMMTYTGIGMLIYIAYTIAALSQLLIYCYGGTLVAENSVQLATVVSTCPWQLCRPQERRMLLLIMLRSQRALSMAVPFFSPSLATFAAILRASGSIIALASSFQ